MERGWTIFVRIWGVIALLALIGVCVSDFFTHFWVEHPMLAAVLAAVLVAAVIAAIVDRYLAQRDLRRWQNVAAIAIGEFSFDARWARRSLLDLAGLPAPDDARESIAHLATADGAAAASEGIDALAHDAEGRARMYADLHRMLDAFGLTLSRWAPLMVQGEHAERLNDFVLLVDRVWKLDDELSKEQLEHREIPLGEDWVAERMAKLIDLCGELELDFEAHARELAPPDAWTGAPSWFTPTHREVART